MQIQITFKVLLYAKHVSLTRLKEGNALNSPSLRSAAVCISFRARQLLVSPGSVGHVQIHFQNRLENYLIPQSNDSSFTNVPRGCYNPVIETGFYNYGWVEKLLLLWMQSLCLTDFCSRALGLGDCWSACLVPNVTVSLPAWLTGLQVASVHFRKHSWPFVRSRIN